jgi:hypothetical protein
MAAGGDSKTIQTLALKKRHRYDARFPECIQIKEFPYG